LEEKLKRLKEEAESAGLHINTNKTKGMTVNTANTQKFSLEDIEIEEVESFLYLGSVISKTEGTEEDVASRIKKANGTYICSVIPYMEKPQYIKKS
jgi:t-SNARE complex subunit (syntaxin)